MNRVFDDIVINKRAIILTFIIIVGFITALYFVFDHFQNNTNMRLNPFKCIPESSLMIFELNKLEDSKNELLSDKDFYNQAKDSIACIKLFDEYLQLLRRNIKQDDKVKKLFNNTKLFVSFHPNNNIIEPLFIIYSKSYLANDAKSILKQLPNVKDIQKANVNKEEIFQINLKNNSTINILFKHNLMFFADNIELIKNVISVIKNPNNSVNTNEKLKKLIETSGVNVDANLYISSRFYTSVFNNNSSKKVNDIILNFADWAAFDIQKNNLDYNFSGFTSYNDSSFLSLFENQSPQPFKALDIVSKNAIYVSFFGISNPNAFFDKIVTKQNNPIIDYIKRFTDNEIVNFTAEYSGGLFNFTLIKINNADSIEDKFKREMYMEQTNINASKNIIYTTQIKESTLFENFAIKSNSNDSNIYFALIDNYVVACEKPTGIKLLFNDFDNDFVLSKQNEFLNFYEKFNANSNVFLFVNDNGIVNILEQNYPDSYIVEFYKILFNYKSRYTAGQYQYANNKFYTAFIIDFNKYEGKKTIAKKTDVIWENSTDTTVISAPYLYTNLINGEIEMIVQDVMHNVYMFDNEGRRIWKKKIDGQIKDIQFIDYYDNKKTQFLISTGGSIHVIDRRGRDVEKYPIKSKDTEEFIFMDFISKSRLIALTSNDDLMMFDKQTKRIKNVKLKGKTNYISKVKGTDRNLYIKTTSKGNMLVFDDSFDQFIAPSKKLDINTNIDVFYINNLKSLYCVTNDNKIVSVSANNNQIRSFDIDYPTNKINNLLVIDFDKDGKKDICFFDQESVSIYNTNRKQIFSQNLNLNCNEKKITQLKEIFIAYCFDQNNESFSIYHSEKGITSINIPTDNKHYLFLNQSNKPYIGLAKNNIVKIKEISIE